MRVTSTTVTVFRNKTDELHFFVALRIGHLRNPAVASADFISCSQSRSQVSEEYSRGNGTSMTGVVRLMGPVGMLGFREPP